MGHHDVYQNLQLLVHFCLAVHDVRGHIDNLCLNPLNSIVRHVFLLLYLNITKVAMLLIQIFLLFFKRITIAIGFSELIEIDHLEDLVVHYFLINFKNVLQGEKLLLVETDIDRCHLNSSRLFVAVK